MQAGPPSGELAWRVSEVLAVPVASRALCTLISTFCFIPPFLSTMCAPKHSWGVVAGTKDRRAHETTGVQLRTHTTYNKTQRPDASTINGCLC